MKTLGITLLGAIAFTISVDGSTAAPASDRWAEKLFEAKFGRPSPHEEARGKAELENTAFREELAAEKQSFSAKRIEEYFKAKFGRSLPSEEARRKGELENTAFREEAPNAERAAARLNWTEQYSRAKWGRDLGKEKADPGQRAR